MKKIIITLAVIISSFSAFATEEVNSIVLRAFTKEFAGVKGVHWTSINGYYKAAFIFNDQHVTAFYQTDGKLLKLSKNISSLDIPVSLQVKLKNNYGDYWISNLLEIANKEGTSYYITLEKADFKLVLKSVDFARWVPFKKIVKS
jgi:hypothetical protein